MIINLPNEFKSGFLKSVKANKKWFLKLINRI